MASLFAYRCSSCDALHEGAPIFDFRSPLAGESPADPIIACRQEGDAWIIEWAGRSAYYVRACLELPIHGYEEPFRWNAWGSLSEASFLAWRNPDAEGAPAEGFFSWFSNRLPGYPDTLNLKTRIHPGGEGVARFELEPTDHPLSVDAHSGMTIERAQALFEQVMQAYHAT